jgi:hypothetical protein
MRQDGNVFTRLIWWTTGAVMGAGGSQWVQRKVKKTVQAKVAPLLPGAFVDTVTTKARSISTNTAQTVRTAVTDGRFASKTREAELRTKLENRRTRQKTKV